MYYLGVDIGASSGRHILGHMEQGALILEEVYRFENRIVQKGNHDCWDLNLLFEEVLQGIRECVKRGKIPKTMAIDTWACDFVLLDATGACLDECVSYRDSRVDGIMEEAWTCVDKTWLYQRTGIQFQKFNTLYQLLALKKEHPELLAKAKHFLMVPDYLNYRLTNVITNEYTNASTTQLVNAHTQRWDEELLDLFDLPKQIFHPFHKPGAVIGDIHLEIQKLVGCQIKVLECATHDTASAYSSVDAKGDIILSSGTWSLLGTVIPSPITTRQAMAANFTNEGAIDGSYRFLKNIMGLWMIQEVRHCLKDVYSFEELVELAIACDRKPSIIDVNDTCFLHPENMIEEIQSWCSLHHCAIPKTPGELALCVYHSLAVSYQTAVLELEAVTKQSYDVIHIVGGGSKNQFLNELTAKATGKKVLAQEKEATIIGNIRMQMKQEEKGNEGK